MTRPEGISSRALLPALLLYAVASLMHFTHNAEFLAAYPNLPGWITRESIYLTWVAIFVVGATGYALYRVGLVYAGSMNLSIWFEAVTAAVALLVTACVAFSVRRGPA